MPTGRPRPHGEWASTLTPERLTAGALRFSEVAAVGERALWIEGRAEESGRAVIVEALPGQAPRDRLPAPYSARSRVHEYGGGAMLANAAGIWFCNDADQRIHELEPDGSCRPVTPEGPWRYADMVHDAGRHRLVCVREDHSGDGEPVNTLVAVDLRGGGVEVLVSGADFYSSPRLSSDGGWLAYLSWDHPDMPWDSTTLWLARLGGQGRCASPRAVAGGGSESIAQPEFDAAGRLIFVSDRDGWWNLYRLEDGHVGVLLRERAEFAMPHWQFGMRCFGLDGSGGMVCASTRDGRWRLERLGPDGSRRELPHPVSAVSRVAVDGAHAVALTASEDAPACVLSWDLREDRVRVLREGSAVHLSDDEVSRPVAVDFATGHYHTAHGFLYRPRNASDCAIPGERPPLIVIGHGGPTGATAPSFSLAVQFWTQRGFAVFDVNYRGSTGYGRAYRDALRGGWGVVDVEDCVNAARHLVEAGEADGRRLIIRGSSAGGYTVLAALAYHDVFSAGASYYGIGELESLARDTHKFESRYLDRLVGPYPEQAARYRERSPIHHVDGLSCPVIFFQGLEDKVVPPNQAELMVEALKAKQIPVACLMFEGEQHGFRKAETQIRTLQAELAFYGRTLGFTPADPLPPLTIHNMD